MIPKEIIETWEKEAGRLYPNMHPEPKNSFEEIVNGLDAEHRECYIQGRTDQYNEQVKEIERLKGMLEVQYKNYCRSAMCDTLDKEETIKYSNASWQQFKQQHNL